uniref:Uncharacterized protein n=1 Tax=Vitis vinifera TaxID=29760 RepID=F6I0X1_VITVI
MWWDCKLCETLHLSHQTVAGPVV